MGSIDFRSYMAAIAPTTEELRSALPDLSETLQRLLDEVAVAPSRQNVTNAAFACEGARRHLLVLLDAMGRDGSGEEG